MLEGTELHSAYVPMGMEMNGNTQSLNDLAYLNELAEMQAPVRRSGGGGQQKNTSTPVVVKEQRKAPLDILPENHTINEQLMSASQTPPAPVSMQQQQAVPHTFNASAFNKTFDMQQEAMRRRMMQQPQQHMAAPQQMPQYVPYHEESYWDKLSQRKKDIWKFLQSGFIILFAISMHFLIDFLLKYYLQNNDVSFERELLLRILYPIAVVFIAWNIIAHLR